MSIMNSQGTGEKNNDERTIRQETNETKSKESTNPVTIFQQKPNLQKNKDERTIRQETNETKQKKKKKKGTNSVTVYQQKPNPHSPLSHISWRDQVVCVLSDRSNHVIVICNHGQGQRKFPNSSHQ